MIQRPRILVVATALALLSFSRPTLAQEAASAPATNPDEAHYVTPPPAVERILRTNKNYAELGQLSPDGDHFLVPLDNELSTLELMSKVIG